MYFLLLVLDHYLFYNLTIIKTFYNSLLLNLNIKIFIRSAFSFINKHICILYFLFCFNSTVLTTKCLFSNIFYIKISNNRIVKLKPFFCFSILYKRIIMTIISISRMNYNSFQNIIIILISLICLFFIMIILFTL
jgi:hypothetical protein